jgi:uncharacterized protein (TIGR02246 family)
MLRLLMISGCALTIAHASSAGAQDAGVRAAIASATEQFQTAFAKQDAAGVAALYTTNGEAYPPNSNVVRGRAEIQKMWKSVIDSGIAGAALTTTEVESSGDLAYESGTYEMKTKDGKVADRGKYVVVWKRVGGRWLLHRDIWNTNQPAQ